MGHLKISPYEIDEIIGDNDFSEGKISFSSFEESRAKKLISAFEKGFWRIRINGPRKKMILLPLTLTAGRLYLRIRQRKMSTAPFLKITHTLSNQSLI